MSQPIAPCYLDNDLRVARGSRIHRLVAMLFDTHIDDLTPERITELEQQVEAFRWADASGKRI